MFQSYSCDDFIMQKKRIITGKQNLIGINCNISILLDSGYKYKTAVLSTQLIKLGTFIVQYCNISHGH